MEKQTKPKTKRAKTLTWKNCLFVGMEWKKYDVNSNPQYTGYFLAHGKFFRCFTFWGYSGAYNTLEYLKPLTPCTVTFHWYRGEKWLETVEIEGGKNDN